MLSYEYIQFINEKVIEYLPRDRITVGDKISFRCPLCGDSRKSATKKRGFYYLKNASFYCFNCGVGLPGIKFLQTLSGEDYVDIKKEYVRLFLKSGLHHSLSAQYEQPADEPGVFDLKPAVKPGWKKPLSDKAKSYLDGRLVTSAPFFKEPLYSCEGRGGAEYILIPWTLCGVEAFYQLNDYLKHGDIKYIFPKNMKKTLYGMDSVDMAWPYIILFEGVYDSLFVKNGVATGTKSVTDYQLRLIRERYPNHRICLSFDNDKPGFVSMSKFVQLGADFMFFRWYDGSMKCKDVNEYVLAAKDVTAFSNGRTLENMIFNPLQMKMWLIQNGKWSLSENAAGKYHNRYRKGAKK